MVLRDADQRHITERFVGKTQNHFTAHHSWPPYRPTNTASVGAGGFFVCPAFIAPPPRFGRVRARGQRWTVVNWTQLDSGQLDSDWTVVSWTQLDSGQRWAVVSWTELDSGQLDSDWTVVSWIQLDSAQSWTVTGQWSALDTAGQWSALESDWTVVSAGQ